MLSARSTYLIATLILMFPNPAVSQDKPLQWMFTAGQTREYVRELTTIQKTKGIGITNDCKVTVICDTSITCNQWNAKEGTGDIVLKVRRIQFRMDQPGSVVEYDSNKELDPNVPQTEACIAMFHAYRNAEITCEVDASGTVKKYIFPDALEAKVKEQIPQNMDLKDAKNAALDLISPFEYSLPSSSKANALEWENTTQRGDSMSTRTLTTKLKRAGQESVLGDLLEKIELSSSVTLKPTANSTIDIKLVSHQGSGTILFDQAKGCIRELTSQQTERSEMKLEGGWTDDYSEQKVTLRLK